jgi:hypothetical protein
LSRRLAEAEQALALSRASCKRTEDERDAALSSAATEARAEERANVVELNRTNALLRASLERSRSACSELTQKLNMYKAEHRHDSRHIAAKVVAVQAEAKEQVADAERLRKRAAADASHARKSKAEAEEKAEHAQHALTSTATELRETREAAAAAEKRADTFRKRAERATSAAGTLLRLNPGAIQRAARTPKPISPAGFGDVPSAEPAIDVTHARKAKAAATKRVGRAAATLKLACSARSAEVQAKAWVDQAEAYAALEPEQRPEAVGKWLYRAERESKSEVLDFISEEVQSVERCAMWSGVSKESGRCNDFRREFFFFRCNDGEHNRRLTVMDGAFGMSPLFLPPPPTAAQIYAFNEARRKEDGTTVMQTEDGRVAFTDPIAAAHHVLEVSEKQGRSARGPNEPHLLVVSSDAGQKATHSAERNETCAIIRDAHGKQLNCSLSATATIALCGQSDSNDGLHNLYDPCGPALNHLAAHNQLPCCLKRFDRERSAGTSCCVALANGVCSLCEREARAAMLLCTGDLKNLFEMAGLGSVRTDPENCTLHKYRDPATGLWQWRVLHDAKLLAHAVPDGTCPACGYTPKSQADCDAERKRRLSMPSGEPKSAELRAHHNQWLLPVLDVEFDCMLLGVMHFCHNVCEQFFSAVWHDIDELYGENALLVKHDVVIAVCNMGATCMRPQSKHRGDRTVAVEIPSFKGGDLSILRTEVGVFTILHLVYRVDTELSGAEPTNGCVQPAAVARANVQSVSAVETLMVSLRAAKSAARQAEIQAAAQRTREGKLRAACRTMDAMWEMERELKDTAYTHSSAAHAKRFSAAWKTFEDSLRTMTSKSVQSQYFTEAREVMPELIEKWGKVVAYVNEQVQEHIVKVVKSIYHKATNHRIDLREYARTLSSGKRLVVTPKTTAHAQMLRRLGDFHRAMGEASDNRTVQRRLKGFGASAWQGKEETPSHQLVPELEEYLLTVLDAGSVPASGAGPSAAHGAGPVVERSP